jgi:archaellum component FlaC
MSEEFGSDDATFDSSAFEEWVEKTAETKGISRGEVLDQMLSSYWILEELTGMMDEAEGDGPASKLEEASGDAEESPDTEKGGTAEGLPEGGDLSELIREFQELRSAIMEMPDRQGSERRRDPPRREWDQPRRQSPPPSRVDDRLQRTISDLQDRFEDLSDELADVQDQHEEDVAALESDIEETLETLDDLESTVEGLVGHKALESLAVSLEQELSRIEEGTEDLEARVGEIEAERSETDTDLAEVVETQEKLEARIEREFDSIENVFQHLLDKTDDLEYRVGAVAETHGDDIEPFEDHVEERERFADLMREAHRKDISTAICDNCETIVDLRLLEEPYCPECDRSISGLEPGGWLPFDKPTAKTEPIGTASEGIEEGAADPSDLLEQPPTD